MPMVGIRVRIWRIRFKMKNIEAIILPILMSGGCGYCAVGEGPNLCGEALYWNLLLQWLLMSERQGRIALRPVGKLRCPGFLRTADTRSE